MTEQGAAASSSDDGPSDDVENEVESELQNEAGEAIASWCEAT